MSDYIRREDVLGIIRSGWSNHYSCKDMCDEIKELPTVDEKEIIRKTVERIVERLEEYRNFEDNDSLDRQCIDRTIEIVKEECEINE